jgi:hypothetical protein
MVIFITTTPTTTSSFSETMKATTNIKGIEKLSAIAVVSCTCSVLYFMVANLLV